MNEHKDNVDKSHTTESHHKANPKEIWLWQDTPAMSDNITFKMTFFFFLAVCHTDDKRLMIIQYNTSNT